MVTGGITASLYWAQSERAGPHRPAPLKSAFLSIAALALVTVAAMACYPATVEGCNQCLHLAVTIYTQQVQCLGHRAIQPHCDHLHCETLHISKGNPVQALSAAYSWAFVLFSNGNTSNSREIHSFCLSWPLQQHVLVYHLGTHCHHSVKPGFKMAKQTEQEKIRDKDQDIQIRKKRAKAFEERQGERRRVSGHVKIGKSVMDGRVSN